MQLVDVNPAMATDVCFITDAVSRVSGRASSRL